MLLASGWSGSPLARLGDSIFWQSTHKGGTLIPKDWYPSNWKKRHPSLLLSWHVEERPSEDTMRKRLFAARKRDFTRNWTHGHVEPWAMPLSILVHTTQPVGSVAAVKCMKLFPLPAHPPWQSLRTVLAVSSGSFAVSLFWIIYRYLLTHSLIHINFPYGRQTLSLNALFPFSLESML